MQKLSRWECMAGSFALGLALGVTAMIPNSEASSEKYEQPIIVEASATPDPLPTYVPLETPRPTVEPFTILKRCKLTAYCAENYPHICNDGDSSTTATGTKPTPGRTIAVDPKVIPYGSKVTINGHTYIAEDCGGAVKGNRVDILFATHKEALAFGIQYADVVVE